MSNFERIFYGIYLILFILGFLVIALTEHGDTVVYLNNLHSPGLDVFFKYATHLGDGVALAVAVVFLLIKKLRFGLILGLVGIVQVIISWFLKHIVFGKTPRPKNYFEDLSQFSFVEGVKLNGWNSFPSGHTMTAFSVAAFLMLMFKRPIWSVLLITGAVLVGISRIYLFQHFLVDVLVGSLIGITLAKAGHSFFKKYLEG